MSGASDERTTPSPALLARTLRFLAAAGDGARTIAEGMPEPKRSAILHAIEIAERAVSDPETAAEIDAALSAGGPKHG